MEEGKKFMTAPAEQISEGNCRAEARRTSHTIHDHALR
jgi:hypothetical protein